MNDETISSDTILQSEFDDDVVDTIKSDSLEKNISLESEVLYYIEQKFPDYYHSNITKPKKVKLQHLSNLFDEFKEIGQEKEKHNLKWAFKKAQISFNFEELQKAKPKTDCFMVYDDVVCEVNKKAKSKINRFSRKFSWLSLGVSMLDMVVSVFLILIVTMLSHIGDQLFNTVLFSTLFIAFVALTKVSLDRFAVMPIIDQYGWNLFNRTINYARDESIKLNAVYLVLLESIARKESVETRFELIRKQKKTMIPQKRFSFLPGFLNPKPTDS